MKSSSVEENIDARPIPVYITTSMDQREEISLVDIWRLVARRKIIILASLLLPILLAIAYLAFSNAEYKAKAYLMPPKQLNVLELLVDQQGLVGIDDSHYLPDTIYKTFLGNLNSRGLQLEFFDSNNLIRHYVSPDSPLNDINSERVFDGYFSRMLDVQIDTERSSFVIISLVDRDPVLAAKWLNQFIEFVNDYTVEQLVSNVNAVVQSKIRQFKYQLDSKMKLADQRRRDKIVALEEALYIAETLGIKDMSTFPNDVEDRRSGLAVNTAEVPLYMRGSKALKTEISVFEVRESDEPFIAGFRDIQEKLAYLEGVSIKPDLVETVTVDEAARVPYEAEKPRKALILILAIFVGVMIAFITVFITEFYSKVRRGFGQAVQIES